MRCKSAVSVVLTISRLVETGIERRRSVWYGSRENKPFYDLEKKVRQEMRR